MARSKPNRHPDLEPESPIIVQFSGGRTSAFMSVYLKERYGDRCIFLFQNTGKEHQGTIDFVDRVDREFNLNLQWLEYRSFNDFEPQLDLEFSCMCNR